MAERKDPQNPTNSESDSVFGAVCPFPRGGRENASLNPNALSTEVAMHIVKNSNALIVNLDREGRVLYVNDAVFQILGYRPEEIVGENWWPLAYPGEKQRQLEQLWSDFAADGDVGAYELIVEAKDGTDRVLRWNSVNRFDEKGEIYEVIGVGEDVTDQRSAENELKRSEARLAEAQRVGHIGSWELEHSSQHFSWSVEALNIFEAASTTELRSYNDFLNRLDTDDRNRLNMVYQDAIENRRPYDITYPISMADGRVKHLRGQCETIYDADGEPLRSIGTVQDITQEVQQEQKLKEMLRVTRDLQEYNDHIVSNSPSFVVAIDPDGATLSINDAGCRLSGYPREEILGKNLWETIYPGKYYDQVTVLFGEFERHGGVRDYEMVLLTKQGEERTIAWTSVNRLTDGGELLEVIGVGQDVTELRRSQQELQNLAHHDPLTNLPNRLYLSVRLELALERAKRRHSTGAILFIDLDRFKNINDSLGHSAGDALLVQVAQRLQACVRHEDTVARIGGDEFTLLLEDVDSSKNAIAVAEKVLAAFGPAFMLEGHEYHVTPSIGVSLFPRDGSDIETLLRNADTAMYQAKEAGRNAFALYDKSLTKEAEARITLENQLRKALAAGEFHLRYQPQVDLRTHELIAAEALIRWHHPERGVISPQEFIPLAEESGLIIPIGEWVLREACRQAQQWQRDGINFGRIAVNIAGAQILRSDLFSVCRAALNETGLLPEFLELEVSEGFIMDKASDSIAQLEKLRALGLFLAIDDFGTGYSSLAYLKRLPVDQIKIDQSFVREIPDDVDDMGITRAVIALANSLNLEVMAEGVETEAQREFLIREGCSKGQGYLFSKPLIAREFTQWAEAHQTAAREVVNLM